jgi:hypothetical protein
MIKTNAMRKYRKFLSITLASLLLASSFSINGGASLAKSASTTLAAAAGSNFVVIIGSGSGGDSFGDEPGSVGGNYRGLEFTYPAFSLPGVDPSKSAVVQLASKNVSTACNRFEINGVQVPALRDHNDSNVWETEIFRIPTGVLKATGNILRIQALNESCAEGGNEDDFIVSNVVIHYVQQ